MAASKCLACFSILWFQQGFCLVLFSLLSLQPEAVRRSHWARHWACAVDVLELLAAESCYTSGNASAVIRDEGHPASTGGREDNLTATNAALKDIIVKLMAVQYVSGKQYVLACRLPSKEW